MRIAVASLDYPPGATEGIARQRQVLAEALARLGHEVHVVTRGPRRESANERGVRIHRYAPSDLLNEFLPNLPVLNRPLTDAQLLCEAVLDVARRHPIDVIDVPLWLAQPLALVRHAPCPVVVWLQTSLLQLVELQGRPLRQHEEVLAAVDRFGLTRSSRCIADSHSVLREIERLYELTGFSARTAVVYPGLDPARMVTKPERSAGLEVLVVGRLEQRKGTPLLLDALPRLLAGVPTLSVRFIGRDNSRSDGYFRDTGQTYPDAFRLQHPELAERVRFDGYVDDATLAAAYARADVLLHPALYESFGLIFLEAMRAALPVVAFATGGATEVFGEQGSSGAVLCAPGDMAGLMASVARLATDPDARAHCGAEGRRRFETYFTSDRMARETVAVYAEAMATARPPAPAAPRVFQVMEALQDRDAVSRITRTNAGILARLGGERPILSVFAEPSVRHETGRIRAARFRDADSAIFHYWGFSRLEGVMRRFPGRKALHYHNITPPHFFSPRSPHYEMTRRGYRQLDRIATDFDLILGDSNYNLGEYARHLRAPRPMVCLYPAVDAASLRAAPWDRALAARLLSESDGPIWLFVGRCAPNKRQDQVMRAFDRFVSHVGGGRLLLVGDTTAVPVYAAELERLRTRLDHGSHITFLSSVDDQTLRACYRVANLFACASEHEGFCVPLAEAMAFGVPIVALDRGAVGETVGEAGTLVEAWDPDRVAGLAADLIESSRGRHHLKAAQRARLGAFSPAAIADRLQAVVRFLRDGIDIPGAIARPLGDTWSTSTN